MESENPSKCTCKAPMPCGSLLDPCGVRECTAPYPRPHPPYCHALGSELLRWRPCHDFGSRCIRLRLSSENGKEDGNYHLGFRFFCCSFHDGFSENSNMVTAMVSWQAPSSLRLQICIRRESPKSVSSWIGPQREALKMRVGVVRLH